MLEARHIAYSYPQGHQLVLNDFSLAVSKGSFIAVLGANGSGKSTLARILAGSLRPHSGEVLLDGAPMDRGWPHVGFVRQDPEDQLVSENVVEEVGFGLHDLGLTPEEKEQRVRLMLEQCNLSYLKDVPTSELSGGEQQRLALAGVLAHDPTYLVLDETTSHLDATSRYRFIKVVEALATKERGIVLITHRLEEALAAQRVVVMDHGSVAWEGSSREFALNERAQELAHLDSYEAPSIHDEEQELPRYELTNLYLNQVSVVLGEYAAVRDVTIGSFAGAVTLMTGRSGSGKTTCSLVAAGLIEPSEGTVSYMGKDVCVGDIGMSL
ncbi:MAG: ATP-binding cassette domain-containing protein, partial [Coriobacteriales bacterium]|nr:ATP-binding cassette domain-containing protein [Coriobacteriales bacterium]